MRCEQAATYNTMMDTDAENTGMPEQDSQVKSLYEVLGVERTASQDVIKKTYYRLCLKLHPDKNPGDEEAKAKFQALQRVYAVLGDAEKRAAYDQTGITDDDLLGANSSTELYQYFRAMFKEVTEDDLDNFYDQYRGSEEENVDLLKHYKEFKGDMAQVFEWLMCSEPDKDAHRFMDAIQAAIDAGKVKSYKAFKSWAKEVAARPRPADPLKKRSKDKQGGMSQALMAIRQKREASTMAFFDHLEQKYSKPGKKKAKQSEPTEEEFEAARQRALSHNSKQDGAEQGKKVPKSRTGGSKKGGIQIVSDSAEEASQSERESEEMSVDENCEVEVKEKKKTGRGKENRTGTANGAAADKGGRGSDKKARAKGQRGAAAAKKKAKA